MPALQQSPTKLPIRAAMEARDRTAVVDAFAEDAIFRSPLTTSLVFTGRGQIEALIDVLLDALEDLSYSDELIADHTAVLVGTMQLRGVSVDFIDHLKLLEPTGRSAKLTVFFRPLPAAAAAMQVIGAGLGRRKSKLRGRTISALVAPLGFLTRAGDGLGVEALEADAVEQPGSRGGSEGRPPGQRPRTDDCSASLLNRLQAAAFVPWDEARQALRGPRSADGFT